MKLLVAKLRAAGLRINKAVMVEVAGLYERIRTGESEEIFAELSILKDAKKGLGIVFDAADADSITKKIESFSVKALPQIVEQFARRIRPRVMTAAQASGAQHQADLTKFRTRLERQWRPAFRQLTAFLVSCTALGQEFQTELIHVQGPGRKLSHKFSALFLLHARACLVSYEIETLIRAGFADGSLARWRTLHEISVVALIIADGDEELAQRYLSYDEIESYRSAEMYQRHHEGLKHAKIDAHVLAALKLRKEHLVNAYGKAFGDENGWAAPLFDGRAPNISELEKYAGRSHMRPYYKFASQQTHASPKGAWYRAGLIPEVRQGHNLLLVGPTNMGLTDPAQLTSLSLLHVVNALLMQEPSVDWVVRMRLLTAMHDALTAAFFAAEERIRKREQKLRARKAKPRKRRSAS